MKRIRKGKDIRVQWAILTNGEPLSLDGRDLTLFVKIPHYGLKQHDFEVEGNVVVFDLTHDEQKTIGLYGFSLYENYGKNGQTAVDVCSAFELVSTTCMESDSEDGCCENLTSITANLETSNLEAGVKGDKGDPGFSPVIEEDENNNEETYRLRIVTAAGEFTTPNLMAPAPEGGENVEYDDTALWDALKDKVDKVDGKGLSEQDFTTALKNKLDSLNNYDDTTIKKAVEAVQQQLNTLLNGNVNGVIDAFNEIEDFLQGITDTQTLTGLLADLKSEIVNLIPSLKGYATREWVGDQHYISDAPTDNDEYVRKNGEWVRLERYDTEFNNAVDNNLIEAGKQYFNDKADLVISRYEGFSQARPESTVVSPTPIVFQNAAVQQDMDNIETDSGYYVYVIRYMQKAGGESIILVNGSCYNYAESDSN